MEQSTAEKLQQLYDIKLENYELRQDYDPQAAATWAVEDIQNMYRNDPYIDQLLDEEIEDALKAQDQYRENIKAGRDPLDNGPEPEIEM